MTRSLTDIALVRIHRPNQRRLETTLIGVSNEERQELIRKGGWLYCRESGHVLKDCKKKPQRYKAECLQVNPRTSHRAQRHRSQILHRFVLHLNDLVVSGNLLVDTGAEGDFIAESFVKSHNLPLFPLNPVHCLVLADGTKTSVSSETMVSITLYSEPPVRLTRTFMVAPIAHDIIPGTLFLHEYDPVLSFRTGIMTLKPPALALASVSLFDAGQGIPVAQPTTAPSTNFGDDKSDPLSLHTPTRWWSTLSSGSLLQFFGILFLASYLRYEISIMKQPSYQAKSLHTVLPIAFRLCAS